MAKVNRKTPRGTARKRRRADMSVFRNERDKRREADSAGTHTFNVYQRRGVAAERNPHGHSVATVTDMRNGMYLLRQYDWTKDYPANVPCPLRAEIAARRYFPTYGGALEVSDEINHIAVPSPKPLRLAA